MSDIKENSSIKIYCFYYKETKIPISNNIYVPVMAGNKLKSLNENYIGDDTKKSISEKNDYYSELTGIYWVWKNTFQDIVGSCHYRRYFTAKKYPLLHQFKAFFLSETWFYKKRTGIIYTRNIDKNRHRILNEQEILEIMKNYDAILPKKRIFRYSIKEHYRKYHDLNDLRIVEDVINSKYPDFLESFHDTLNNNWLYVNNMFILTHIEFNRLMEWLFDILFEFERRVNTENYKDYQKRVFGFISERLITVWFNYQKLNVKELPIIFFKNLKYS